MLAWLDKEQIKELTDKRLKLKEKLEGYVEDGIKLDLWQVDTWAAGKRPLLLLARMTYSSLPGKADYRLIMCQPGKQGAVYTWECPATMPGVEQKNQGGRPVKYGAEAAEKAKALRDEKKLSIRQIAKELNASTFTIQRLLKA